MKKGMVVLIVVCASIFIGCGNTPGSSAAGVKKSALANCVKINGGTFTMGADMIEANNEGDERPQHQVTVSSFYMGKYEVTQKEWVEVMESNPSYFKGDNLPVENVSWYDAIEYCNKLSIKEELSPAYTVNGTNVTWDKNVDGYRLPTEAEWEYACRAGTTTLYNSGNSVDNAGWYDRNSEDRTHSVGQKAANSWGLYDMHGNVWEWCWDQYGSYSSNPQTDPSGAEARLNRVDRGGGWDTHRRNLRSAYRGKDNPSFRSSLLGFRLARSEFSQP